MAILRIARATTGRPYDPVSDARWHGYENEILADDLRRGGGGVHCPFPPLLRTDRARYAQITSKGQPVKTVDLMVDQEFTVDGKNTVTVQDGKIAVTWADCPDHYCMKRGFCDGGTDIVCLPNRLVITFLGDQEVDAAIG